MTNVDSILKSRHYFSKKGLSVQGYGFSSGHVWTWELDYKEGWMPKNWCFWTMVLEKSLERVPWTARRSSQSMLKEIIWIFIGRTDAETETPILWPPDGKNWLTRKAPDAGKDWRQEQKGLTKWNVWMASLTRWTSVLVSSRSWWWTGRPCVLQSTGLQRVRHDWVTELMKPTSVPYCKIPPESFLVVCYTIFSKCLNFFFF